MKVPGGGGISARDFLLALKAEVDQDDLTDLAAAVTYYTVQALFPFLLFLVALASVVVTPRQAEQLAGALGQVAPGPVAQIVGDRIRSLAESQSVGLLTVGALLAIWSASGAVSALMRGLDRAYDVREGRPWWKKQGIALVMTVVSAALALLAAIVMVVLGPVGEALGWPLGTAIAWLRWPVAGLIVMFLWALVYYVLPDVEQKFKFITPGSFAGVILWLVASWGFSVYVAHFGSYEKTYGSLGGVIVLVLWLWISSLVVLLGAEVNAVIERASPEGKREGQKRFRHAALPARATTSRPHEDRAPAAVPDASEGAPRPRAPAAPRPRVRDAPPAGVAREGHPRALVLAGGALAGILLLRRRPA